MANQNESKVTQASAVSELDRRLEELTRISVSPPTSCIVHRPEKRGFASYIARNLHSRIAIGGAAALIGFFAGGKYYGSLRESYAATKAYAGRCFNAGVKTAFNALPEQQKYEIIRENAKKLKPDELRNELNRLSREMNYQP